MASTSIVTDVVQGIRNGTLVVTTLLTFRVVAPPTYITTHITRIISRATAVATIYLLDGSPYTSITMPTSLVLGTRYVTKITTSIGEEPTPQPPPRRREPQPFAPPVPRPVSTLPRPAGGRPRYSYRPRRRVMWYR